LKPIDHELPPLKTEPFLTLPIGLDKRYGEFPLDFRLNIAWIERIGNNKVVMLCGEAPGLCGGLWHNWCNWRQALIAPAFTYPTFSLNQVLMRDW
jgi:hypothetical protein